MKLTKLSLVAALAVSAVMAGGDIAPVEPTVEAPAAVITSYSIHYTKLYDPCFNFETSHYKLKVNKKLT